MAVIDNFVSDFNGKVNVSFDGVPANAGQCVQPVGFYARDYLHTPVMWADAAFWYLNFAGSALEPYYDRIANAGSEVPQPGDIVIWNTDLPNSGGAGHIAVCVVPRPGTGTFISFDSNWGGKYCHQVVHTYDYVLGWLRPKTNQGGSDVAIIQDAENWYQRCNRTHLMTRGVALPRETFVQFVGSDFLHFAEACEDNPNADQWFGFGNVGKKATEDNWPGQIYALQDQLKASQDVANKTNEELAKVLGDSNATKAQLKAALENVAKANAQLTTANDKLAEIQKQQAADQETGNRFLRWLGGILNLNNK